MTRRNADKPSVFLRIDRGWLKPETSYDAEVLGRYANGSVVEVVLHEPQSEQQARLLWRVLGIVADNSDYANAEALMTALKVKLQHVDSVSLIGGGLHLIPPFEAFFEHARPGLHLPVYSALYTGQRSIDVVMMKRPAPGANAIELVARKTGAAVFVPIHSEYREILTRTHIDHEALHLREDGAAWTLAAYRTAWQRDLTSVNAKGQPTQASPAKKAAMARLREAGFVFHGLRKNAVNMLLEAGNTEAEVSAIVEMSEQMVRHYSRDVNKRRLAVNGMKKLEEAWKETRANLFGAGSPSAH